MPHTLKPWTLSESCPFYPSTESYGGGSGSSHALNSFLAHGVVSNFDLDASMPMSDLPLDASGDSVEEDDITWMQQWPLPPTAHFLWPSIPMPMVYHGQLMMLHPTTMDLANPTMTVLSHSSLEPYGVNTTPPTGDPNLSRVAESQWWQRAPWDMFELQANGIIDMDTYRQLFILAFTETAESLIGSVSEDDWVEYDNLMGQLLLSSPDAPFSTLPPLSTSSTMRMLRELVNPQSPRFWAYDPDMEWLLDVVLSQNRPSTLRLFNPPARLLAETMDICELSLPVLACALARGARPTVSDRYPERAWLTHMLYELELGEGHAWGPCCQAVANQHSSTGDTEDSADDYGDGAREQAAAASPASSITHLEDSPPTSPAAPSSLFAASARQEFVQRFFLLGLFQLLTADMVSEAIQVCQSSSVLRDLLPVLHAGGLHFGLFSVSLQV